MRPHVGPINHQFSCFILGERCSKISKTKIWKPSILARKESWYYGKKRLTKGNKNLKLSPLQICLWEIENHNLWIIKVKKKPFQIHIAQTPLTKKNPKTHLYCWLKNKSITRVSIFSRFSTKISKTMKLLQYKIKPSKHSYYNFLVFLRAHARNNRK